MLAQKAQLGRVTELSSSRRPLAGVYIHLPLGSDVPPTQSDANGYFHLRFSSTMPGERISGLVVNLKKYEIVNNKDFSGGWIFQPKDTIKVYLARLGVLDSLRAMYYDIGAQHYEQNFAKERKELGEKFAAKKIEQASYQEQIEHLRKKYELLGEQLKEYADYYSRVNEDELNEIDAKALTYFRNGNIESALMEYRKSGILEKYAKLLDMRDSVNVSLKDAKQSIKNYAKLCFTDGKDQNLEEAKKYFEKVALCDTTDFFEIFDYGIFLGKMNDFSEGIRWLNVALRHASTDQQELDCCYWIANYNLSGSRDYFEAFIMVKHAINLCSQLKDYGMTLSLFNFIPTLFRFSDYYKSCGLNDLFPVSSMNQALNLFANDISLEFGTPETEQNKRIRALAKYELAELYVSQQQPAEADSILAESQKILAVLLPFDSSLTAMYTKIYALQGTINLQFKRYQVAEQYFLQSMELAKRIFGKNPDSNSLTYFSGLANLANFYGQIKNFTASGKYFSQCQKFYNSLLSDGKLQCQSEWALLCVRQSRFFIEQSDSQNAENLLLTAMDIKRSGNKHSAETFSTLKALVGFYSDLVSNNHKATEIGKEFLEYLYEPDLMKYESFKSELLSTIAMQGVFLYNQDENSLAVQYFNAVIEECKIQDREDLGVYSTLLAMCNEGLGAIAFGADMPSEALDFYKNSMEYLSTPITESEEDQEIYLAKILSCISTIYASELRYDSAMVYTSRAIEIYSKDIATNPDCKILLANCYMNLSLYHILQKSYALALNAAEAGLKIESNSTEIKLKIALIYLLTDKYEEAKKIYLKFKDEVCPENRDRTYKYYILEDINKIQEARICHPNIERILKELNL
jgi:hypothetical protein